MAGKDRTEVPWSGVVDLRPERAPIDWELAERRDRDLTERPLPTLARRRIYRGETMGRIKSIAPDPLGRFLLFLTRENRTLYRIDFPGSSPAVLLDQGTTPYLANVGFIMVRQHATEGRHVHLCVGTSWETDLTQPRSVIILRDGDDDGQFDAPEVVSMAQWRAYGYDSAGAWVPVCHLGPR